MSQIVIENSLLTKAKGFETANAVYNNWLNSNTYVCVGVESPYAANDSLVPVPNLSTDYINNIFKNIIGIKKIIASDLAFVIPRIDWQTGTTYSQWDDQIDMYTYLKFTQLDGTVNVNNSRTVSGTNTSFNTQLTTGQLVYLPGDGEYVAPQTLQVTDVFSNTSLNVNTSFSGSFISNNIYSVSNTYPDYTNQFYVRNAYDQIFVCLYNNNGAASNVMPQISLGGQLPESPWIVTADGYKWKYLYTIPPGQKQKFFSSDWMPVYSDEAAVSTAVDGRLDIILIEAPGTAYNQNLASNSSSIISITGDGTGANVTAVVNSTGSIVGVNILDGGQGYHYANVVVQGNGTGANLRAIIGPPGGHGFDPLNELGVNSLILSQTFAGEENGTIPTVPSVGSEQFSYRQISLLQNPLLTSGNTASNTNYSTVSFVSVQPPGGGQYFHIDETVYQGSSLSQATFSATVVYWDDVNFILWLNNIQGTFTPQSAIVGTVQTNPVTAFTLTPSVVDLFSGKILYTNNILPVVRNTNQTEQVRVIFNY
jgi:hypothetical protein